MDDHRIEFTRCWERDAARVAAYARRHVPASQVQDAVAETFLQAWRRWPDVPSPPLPWLIATARRVIANQRRGAGRQRALTDRLALLADAAAPAGDSAEVAAERLEALRALAALPEEHREAVLLVAWDGLSTAEAARVCEIRPGTFRVRLHRARLALQAALEKPPAADEAGPGHRPYPVQITMEGQRS